MLNPKRSLRPHFLLPCLLVGLSHRPILAEEQTPSPYAATAARLASVMTASQLWWDENGWSMHATVRGATDIDPKDPLRFNPRRGSHVVITMTHEKHPPRELTLERSRRNVLDTTWTVDGEDAKLDDKTRDFIDGLMAKLDWKGVVGRANSKHPE